MRIYLVGCGKAKTTARTEAGELYTGSLFRAARRYVLSQRGIGHWWILSAAHGLVEPRAVIEPYDETLSRGGREKRQAWAAKVLRQLTGVYAAEDRGGIVFVMLAGDAYTRELVPIMEAVGFTVREPLRGLQLGQRLRWFKENTKSG